MARTVPVIPVPRQEDHQFKASLGYRAKPYLKSNKRERKTLHTIKIPSIVWTKKRDIKAQHSSFLEPKVLLEK